MHTSICMVSMTHNAKVFEMRARISNTLALCVIVCRCVHYVSLLCHDMSWHNNEAYGKL